jgi:uncharacterized protein YjiS (DUF1127 family)
MAATHTNIFYTSPVRSAGIIAHVVAMVKNWNDARATRVQLSKLTDRELSDIGLCRGDIDAVVENAYR